MSVVEASLPEIMFILACLLILLYFHVSCSGCFSFLSVSFKIGSLIAYLHLLLVLRTSETVSLSIHDKLAFSFVWLADICSTYLNRYTLGMDRRSWPWKKKSSDKSSNTDVLQSSNQAEQVCAALCLLVILVCLILSFIDSLFPFCENYYVPYLVYLFEVFSYIWKRIMKHHHFAWYLTILASVISTFTWHKYSNTIVFSWRETQLCLLRCPPSTQLWYCAYALTWHAKLNTLANELKEMYFFIWSGWLLFYTTADFLRIYMQFLKTTFTSLVVR